MPKTFDDSEAGRLTRDFISRFGSHETVATQLYCHFNSRGWTGKTSDHYRHLRQEAREWLVLEENWSRNSTATRQMREPQLDLSIHSTFGLGAKCAEPGCIAKFATLSTDEVEHGQAVFVRVLTQAAAKLLQMNGQTLRRAKE